MTCMISTLELATVSFYDACDGASCVYKATARHVAGNSTNFLAAFTSKIEVDVWSAIEYLV
jgi:hypothetical protein